MKCAAEGNCQTITGAAICCVRATVGQAAALSTPAMNSRRRIRYSFAGSIAYRDWGCVSGPQSIFLQRARQLVADFFNTMGPAPDPRNGMSGIGES
jgi:hypothetical protein